MARKHQTEVFPDEVRTYSTGMERRLLLARGLVDDPQVLFLDEPTGGVGLALLVFAVWGAGGLLLLSRLLQTRGS